MLTPRKARNLRKFIESAQTSLNDTDALRAVELFPSWKVGHDYNAGERVRFEGTLYKCVQPHMAQADWTPDITPALWTPVAEPGEIPVWKQPTGAQDAYNTGDKVHYPTKEDPVYESLIDNNTWSPAAYPAGWQVVSV